MVVVGDFCICFVIGLCDGLMIKVDCLNILWYVL